MADAANNDQAFDQDQETGEKTEPLDKWLYALKEDLASWISRLLKIDITVETFINKLETGVVLCKLANFIQNIGDKFFSIHRRSKIVFPRVGVTFKERGALRGSFMARDNVCNFIRWCRDVGVSDVIMFETEDLVSNKNEKAVLLTLLEVARKVFKVGVDPPELVRLENEIDKELQYPEEPRAEPIVTVLKKKHKSHSLDDLVFEVQKKCRCPTMYPVHRISDGKYSMGESKNLIFVRVMRKHVMVRVGGGWDTLDRYFEKHDPCRLVVHRRSSKTPRPSSAGRPLDEFGRSPSSVSMASLSSSESCESTGTAGSVLSSSMGSHKRSPRSRTISGNLTPDRCLSPRRGSHSRHRSPCARPPRTMQTKSALSKSKSLQDLQRRRGSEPVGLGSSLPVPRRRTSTAPGIQPSVGARRRSVAVTPRRDDNRRLPQTARQPSSSKSPTPRGMYQRSKSMADLNKSPLKTSIPSPSPRKSRPSSATKTRPSSATGDRSRSEGPRSATPGSRRASTSQVSRRQSTSVSSESPRRRPPLSSSSPASSPRTTRRSSSTPRGTYNSPVSSPRVSRKKSSPPKTSLVYTPDPMRRAISNLSSPPSRRRVSRSASFGSKDDLSRQILSNGTGKAPSPRKTGMSGIPRPVGTPKSSKVPIPIKVPGKQSPAKTTKIKTTVESDLNKLPNGSPYGSPSKSFKHSPDPCDDSLPLDTYSMTSEDTSSLMSDREDYCLLPNEFGLSSRESTIIKPSDGPTGDGHSTSEYDYLDCESDLSGVKSPRSISSGYSFGASPTKELVEPSDFMYPVTEEFDEVGNVGILERLKSLNVEQSSVRPTLRGKIFTEQNSPSHHPNTSFSFSEYMQKEPEERSKFFDIEKEFPQDGTDGDEIPDITCPESPRKFSLVHALIGSIERRNEPLKKRADSFESHCKNAGELPTQPHSGSEAMAGSRGRTPDVTKSVEQSNIEETGVIPLQRLDENDNLTNDQNNSRRDDLKANHVDTTKNSNDVKTGSPKHKQLAMDSFPRPICLDEMFDEVKPGDSGKEPAFQAII